MNFYAVGGSLNAPSIAEIVSRRSNFAINTKLETIRIRHAKAGLVGNAVFSHASCNGCIPTQATNKPVILILCRRWVGNPVSWSVGRNGRLAHLNFRSVGIQ